MRPSWHETPYLKPLPAPGLFFHRRSIETFTKPPRGCFIYGACYFPTDNDKPGQPACLMVVELDMQRNVYLSECYHQSVDMQEAVKWMIMIHEGIHISTVEETNFPIKQSIYGARTWFTDPQQFQKIEDLAHFELSEMKRKDIKRPRNFNISALPNPLDFHRQVKTMQGEMIARRFKIPKSNLWTDELMSELCQWPAVRTDARVRCLAIIAAAMPEMSAPARAEVSRGNRGSAWTS